MKNQIKSLATTAIFFALAQTSNAATVAWDGGGANSDWLTAANWGGDAVPGATTADIALIIQGDVATVGSTVTSSNAVGITMRNGGQLTIGANMTSLGDLRIGTSGSLAATTNVFHNSGTLTSSGFLQLGTDPDDTGVWEVASSASIFNLGSFFTIGATGELQYTLDASGAGSINSGGAFTVDGTDSKLTLDLSGFSGTGTFELVTFNSIVGAFDAGKITGLTGLSGGRTASITYDSNSMNLNIIPEPSSYALLAGITGLAIVMVRRRK